MKKIYKMALVFMVAMLAMFGPNVMPAQTATTITAEAASTSVKALTVGKSYTISGYSKVKSSKTSIATSTKKSSKKYTIKAKKKGTTTLKCYNASGKLVKTVYLITTNSSSFKYDTTAITLTKGKTKTVTATVQSGCTVKYSSSKTSVATVSSAGKITAKKAGSATISAKVYYKGKLIKTMKKNVTVKNATSTASSGSSGSSSSSSSSDSSSSGSTSGSSSSTTTVPTLSYTFDTSAATISPGKTASIKATVTSGYTVAYSSSNTSVATVSSAGVVTGVSGGTATITVKISYSGTVYKTLTKKVTVRTYQLSSTSLSVDKGSTATLKCATSAGEYSSSDSFVWTSSSTSVATVSGSGYSATVKGVKAGTATITCTVNGKVTLTCSVTVNKVFTNHVSDTSISVSGGSSTSVGVYYANSTDEVEFVFSSDIVKVSNIVEGTAFYDGWNEMNGYCSRVQFYGRTAGTCNLYIYINDSLFKTIPVTVTSTDDDYWEYTSWRKNLETSLWTSSMSGLRKIIEVGDYVFGSQAYNASNNSPYGYVDGIGGSCWASAQLLVDVAHDLGYEAYTYYPFDNSSHSRAKIIIDGVSYSMEATNSLSGGVGTTGSTCVWKEGILIYCPDGTSYTTKPD